MKLVLVCNHFVGPTRLPIEESCLPRETTRTKKGVKKNKRKQIKQTLSATPTGSYNKRPAARPSNQRKKVGIQKFDEDEGGWSSSLIFKLNWNLKCMK